MKLDSAGIRTKRIEFIVRYANGTAHQMSAMTRKALGFFITINSCKIVSAVIISE